MRGSGAPSAGAGLQDGELKFKELRARSKVQLGERFDAREFQDVALGSGAVPLDVLERIVDDWIERERRKAR